MKYPICKKGNQMICSVTPQALYLQDVRNSRIVVVRLLSVHFNSESGLDMLFSGRLTNLVCTFSISYLTFSNMGY